MRTFEKYTFDVISPAKEDSIQIIITFDNKKYIKTITKHDFEMMNIKIIVINCSEKNNKSEETLKYKDFVEYIEQIAWHNSQFLELLYIHETNNYTISCTFNIDDSVKENFLRKIKFCIELEQMCDDGQPAYKQIFLETLKLIETEINGDVINKQIIKNYLRDLEDVI